MNIDDFSKESLDIFARSSSFSERRLFSWDYDNEKISENQLKKYLRQWEQVLSKREGKERLQRYFLFENINEEELKKLLSPVSVNEQTVLPAWLIILEAIKTKYKASTEVRNLIPVTKIPFGDILHPMVSIFRQEFEKKVENYAPHVEAEVISQLEHSFLKLISKTVERVLFDVFSCFRELSNLDPEPQTFTGKSEIYQQFAANMLEGGFYELLTQYPVLARIISLLTLNLAKANARFINRFLADYQEINNHLFPNSNIGKLEKVQTSLSDRHKEGESVVILTFENESQVVYKPKNLDLAENFNQLVDWFNNQGYEPTFKCTKLINKQAYGWVEFIPFVSCESEKEVQLYYKRAGNLAGLLHLLRSTDCHFENIIANNSYPVLIDFETLLHPNALPMHEGNRKQIDTSENFYKKRDSVLRTLLFPTSFGERKNIGGLGGATSRNAVNVLRCLNPNTDQMNYVKMLGEVPLENNVPHLNQHPKRIHHYQDELKEGFEQFYRFLINSKMALLSNTSPLYKFNNIPQRFIFRHTYIYASILNNLLNPKYLSDGIAYGIQLEMLTRGFLTLDTKPMFWGLLEEERFAMMNQDIPFYATSTSTRSLEVIHKLSLEDYFEKSGFQAMMDVLHATDEQDLEFQIKEIGASICPDDDSNSMSNQKVKNQEAVL